MAVGDAKLPANSQETMPALKMKKNEGEKNDPVELAQQFLKYVPQNINPIKHYLKKGSWVKRFGRAPHDISPATWPHRESLALLCWSQLILVCKSLLLCC